MREQPRGAQPSRPVSIRARHCWRAMPALMIGRSTSVLFQSAPAVCMRVHLLWFQSAPAIAGGRCTQALSRCCPTPGFQSAPAIAGGRCFPANCKLIFACLFQSAPAIAGGRCRYLKLAYLVAIRFNPRPPLLAGDAGHLARAVAAGGVSIRARHCWRAMLMFSGREPIGQQFQSAPATAGGRCTPAPSTMWPKTCFNPRPPLLAGDAS